MRQGIYPCEPDMRAKGHTRRIIGVLFMLLFLLLPNLPSCASAKQPPTCQERQETVKLPEPRYRSNVSVEEALLNRRSVRKYSGEPLTMAEISQLLWAAQGITDPRGFRTAPSAGALYPLEVYLVVGDIEGLDSGVYKYSSETHEMAKIVAGDPRKELAAAALGQEWVEEAAINIVFTVVYERTTQKYGERGIRYVHMEAGHAAQNLYLQAEALGLGMVVVGAFDDDQVKEVVCAPADEQPLYVIPVGRKQ